MALWTPSGLNPIYWIDASTMSLNNNAAVSTWEDISADGFDVTSGNDATFKTNVLNGLPTVYFGGADYLENSSFNNLNGATAYSLFSVAKPTATNGNIYAIGTPTVFGIQYYQNTLRTYVGSVSGYFSSTSTAYNLRGAIYDGSQATNATKLKVNQNGGDDIALTFSGTVPASIGNTNGMAVGRPYATVGAYFVGSIAEIIMIGSVLSTDDRRKVEGYLAWKWGLQAELPAGHPYEDAAPAIAEPMLPIFNRRFITNNTLLRS
jgi:hypothetical protein